MQARIDYYKLSPGGYKAVLGLEQYLASTSLEKKLLHLIKLRVSQINGCNQCVEPVEHRFPHRAGELSAGAEAAGRTS
jgi:alkylhydroperoxidase family enzyme